MSNIYNLGSPKTKFIQRAITISVVPEYYGFSFEKQLTFARSMLIKLLAVFKMSLVCEKTIAGNAHFHGIISSDRFPTVKMFDGAAIKALYDTQFFGFCCIKKIDSLVNWLDYCFKCNPIVVCDDTKLFTYKVSETYDKSIYPW